MAVAGRPGRPRGGGGGPPGGARGWPRRYTLLEPSLTLASGCYPGIAWLPDSSGFVYTGGKDERQLLLYDLKTKASRVVVADVGGPAWPAVSRLASGQ